MVAFSVITPTVCRSSLARTIASVRSQLGPYDEHVIVADGDMQPWVEAHPQARLFSSTYTGGYGNAQRDAGIMAARGDYLLFVDDDDVLAEGALDVIRPIVADDPGALFLFREEYNGYDYFPNGTILWRDPVIRDGNVGSGMIVCPKLPNTPSWCKHGLRRYNADLYFAMEAAAVTKRVIWRTEVITRTRPPI